ncbi:MAG TPA: hypothetical protein VHK64_08560 [Nocardioidaceae bacterium]|jgi:hypothetical protein|nr:hypothetical protein [Nocardioidaceae bacterium]
MTDKQKYWIRDVEGVYAQVEGADQRDQWTKVRGWSEADEPGPTDLVHVANENPEIAQGHPVPFGALEGWAGYGFYPAPPPGADDMQTPAPAAQAEPVKPTKAPAAAGGEQKEK